MHIWTRLRLQNPCSVNVAHGYFIVSAAAGLFVDAAPGPVIANYGMDNLRFVEPVKIDDTIQVELTCKQKTQNHCVMSKTAWCCGLGHQSENQRNELVATYDILTLVEKPLKHYFQILKAKGNPFDSLFIHLKIIVSF